MEIKKVSGKMTLFMRFVNLFKRKKKEPIQFEKTYYGFIVTLVNGLNRFDVQELKKVGFGSDVFNMPDLFDGTYEKLVEQSKLVYGLLEQFPNIKKKMLHQTDMKTFFNSFFMGDLDRRFFNEGCHTLFSKWKDVTCLETTLMSSGLNQKTIWNYIKCAALHPHLIDGYLMTHWFSEISWTMDPNTEIQRSILKDASKDASKDAIEDASSIEEELRKCAIKRYQAIWNFLIDYKIPEKHSQIEHLVTFEEFNKQFFDALNENGLHMRLFIERNPFFTEIFLEQTGLENIFKFQANLH